MKTTLHATALTLALAGCDAAPLPQGEGVDLPSGPCGHGIFVVATDYQSTSVSILRWDGSVASEAILTSGSEAPGLSAALSGDVVTPTTRTTDGHVVLIDRYAGVLTFFDPRGPTVRAQLSVQTGFAANPHDYLEVDGGRGYVTRYGRNLDPGKEPFDLGGDILVIDPGAPAVVGRIDLDAVVAGQDPDLLPTPNRMVKSGTTAYVLVAASSRDFKKGGDARLVAIDTTTDSVVGSVALTGLRSCEGLAISPSGRRIGVLCSGTFTEPNAPSLDDAGIAIVSADAGALHEEKRLELPDQPLGFSAAFASERRLLATTFGRIDDANAPLEPDHLVEYDVESGDVKTLFASDARPFTLGDVRCEPTCGACVLADASRAALQLFPQGSDGTGEPAAFRVDDDTGMPPRYVGAY